MSVSRSRLVILAALAAAVAACNFQIQKPGFESAASTGLGEAEVNALIQEPSRLTYQTIREKILAPKCLECHGVSGGVSLETYESTQEWLDEIRHTAVDRRTMPKGGQLSRHEIRLLKAWLDLGAPENGKALPDGHDGHDGNDDRDGHGEHDGHDGRGGNTGHDDGTPRGPDPEPSSAPAPVPSALPSAAPSATPSTLPSPAPSAAPSPVAPVLTPTWHQVSNQIFQAHCMPCHSATSDNPDFTSLATIRNEGASAILDRVFVEQDMPPRRRNKMRDSDRALLKSWLEAGMPE